MRYVRRGAPQYTAADSLLAAKDTSDKVKSTMKPDSEKSTLEKGSEQVKGTADSVAGKAQPGTI